MPRVKICFLETCHGQSLRLCVLDQDRAWIINGQWTGLTVETASGALMIFRTSSPKAFMFRTYDADMT